MIWFMLQVAVCSNASLDTAKQDLGNGSKANGSRVLLLKPFNWNGVERESVDGSASVERVAREPKWRPTRTIYAKRPTRVPLPARDFVTLGTRGTARLARKTQAS